MGFAIIKRAHFEMRGGVYLSYTLLSTVKLQVWNFETIDSADISDERSVDPDTPNLWYGQDASGAIWKIDIVVSHTVSLGQ